MWDKLQGDWIKAEVLRVAARRKSGEGDTQHFLDRCKLVREQRATEVFPCGEVFVGDGVEEDHVDLFARHLEEHEDRKPKVYLSSSECSLVGRVIFNSRGRYEVC